MQRFINNWATTLVAPALAADLQIEIDADSAALLEGIGGGTYYVLTLARVVDGVETEREIVRAYAATGGVLDVARGEDGSSALDWEVGELIELRLTAGATNALHQSVQVLGQYVKPMPTVAVLELSEQRSAHVVEAISNAFELQFSFAGPSTSNMAIDIALEIVSPDDALDFNLTLPPDWRMYCVAPAGTTMGDPLILTLPPAAIYFVSIRGADTLLVHITSSATYAFDLT